MIALVESRSWTNSGSVGTSKLHAFGLARPIQERPREPFELLHRILEPADRGQDLAVGALELVGRGEGVGR